MPHIAANGIELFYETAGDRSNPPLLLIAGLGVQMVSWPPHFIEALQADHFVITFDNRDIGLSTTFDGAPGVPSEVLDAVLNGREPEVAYRLSDMADDAVALLAALGIDSAHILGVSMGGMIAQAVAIHFPEQVRSLISIMSTTGEPEIGQPSPVAMEALFGPGPASDDRGAAIEHNLKNARIWASPDHYDEERLREVFSAQWDRVGGLQSENVGRHFCAAIAGPSREKALADLRVPTLVVHGTSDSLIDNSGGVRTAELVPNAEYLAIEGMGHDVPPAFTERIVAAIAGLIASAE